MRENERKRVIMSSASICWLTVYCFTPFEFIASGNSVGIYASLLPPLMTLGGSGM